MTFDETSRPYEDEDDIGADNEDSESASSLPAAPADDDAEMGDTDQHSSSDS